MQDGYLSTSFQKSRGRGKHAHEGCFMEIHRASKQKNEEKQVVVMT